MKTEHKVTIGIILLTVLIILGGTLLTSRQSKEESQRKSVPLMGEKMPDLGGQHIAHGEKHAAYNSNPPTSGPHWADVAGGGIKDAPVPDELMLHSMEHGAAVVWYREGLPQSDIEQITQAFNATPGKKIMVPRKDLDTPVALTSWGHLLKLNSIDQNTIEQFIATNNDRTPEKAPI